MTAKQFRQFLKRHNWTAYQFHKDTGLPKSTVYRWADEGITSEAHILLIRMIDRFGLPQDG